LILPAPAFQRGGKLVDGQDLAAVLSDIPKSITVIGGNLGSGLLNEYKSFDLLQDEEYLVQNAAITAECAIRIATIDLPVTLPETPVLILGWGKIGKHLAKLLCRLDCDISIAARKESDLGMITSLGFHAVTSSSLPSSFTNYRILFNTVPAEVLPAHIAEKFPANCRMIDLASSPGIGGDHIIEARGLPGKLAPESSGYLIGETILRYLQNEEAAR
jgi:dipicolinate synthase subunit A